MFNHGTVRLSSPGSFSFKKKATFLYSVVWCIIGIGSFEGPCVNVNALLRHDKDDPKELIDERS